MFMIIASHSVVHGIMATGSDEAYMVWNSSSAFNKILTSFLVPGGDVGVGVFFIITGFFLSKKSKVRNISKLISQVLFWSLLLTAVTLILGSINEGIELSAKQYVRLLLTPISGDEWWFLSSYVLLVLLCPAINSFLSHVDDRNLIKVIFIEWFLWQVLGKIIGTQYSELGRAIFLYSVGAYASRQKDKKIFKNTLFLSCIFCINWILYSVATYYIGVFSAGSSNTLIADGLKLFRVAVFAPVCALALFMLFSNLHVAPNKKINGVSKLLLGVYLFHDNYYFREFVWNGFLHIQKFYLKNYFVVYEVAIVITIFLIGAFVDSLRQRFFENKMVGLIQNIMN